MAHDSLDVSSILKRAADKGGFVRTKYIEKNVPISTSDITVITYFGDLRSIFILSSLLLKRYREEMKGSKYFIICTWPGFEGLFPYVDEYWTIKDVGIVSKFYSSANCFKNDSQYTTLFQRSLNLFFEEAVDASVLLPYYNNGITQAFWDRFKHVKVTLPSVPSAAILGPKFNKDLVKKAGYKIFYYPALQVQNWSAGRLRLIKSMKEFWVVLAERLLKEGFIPVVYRGYQTHDISKELTDRCIYFEEQDVSKILGMMRSVDCTLDVFSSISRLAIAARAPFVYFDERSRHLALKEYEIDGLCCSNDLPREYIWGFPTLIENGNLPLWEGNLFANIIIKLNKLLPDMDRNKWPIPSEGTNIIPYDSVRQRKVSRFGTRFIKIEHD